LRRLENFTRVTVCSGNHDKIPIDTQWLSTGEPPGERLLARGAWNRKPHPGRKNRGYRAGISDYYLALMEKGGNLRVVKGWHCLVLHHIPPTWHSTVNDSEEVQAEG
jgi:hypothetical protein